VPTQWANFVLKEDVNAWDVAIKAWSTPNEDAAVSGYDRIIAEAGSEYTWEDEKWLACGSGPPAADRER